MKGGKDEEKVMGPDEEKVMGPMFPRLHVNDTEKGGPRPPPRNKMALHEQLSVPSWRFNSHTTSAFHPRSNKTNTLVASASSSQGGSCERSVFSSFCIPPPTTHSTEKLHSHSSDQMNLNAMVIQLERNSMRKVGYKASNTTRNSSSTCQCSISHTHNSSNSNNSSGKKIRYEDDFVVPTFVQSGISQGLNVFQHGRERSTPYSAYPGRSTAIEGISLQKSMVVACNSSFLLQKTHDKPLKEIGTTDLKVRKQKRNLSEEKPKETVAIRDRFEKSGSQPLTGKINSKPLRHVSASLNQEHHSSPINELQSLQNKNSQLYLESARLQQENNCIDENDVAERENALRVRSDWCSRDSLEKCPNQVENYIGEDEDKANESMRVRDQNDDITDTSMVDSISRSEISPDDVVEVMGQKNFWDARREIANQQRVFAVQVFELHRLIKVQKLISASPDILLESNPYLGRPSLVVPVKKKPSEHLLKSLPQVVLQKNDSHKPSKIADHLSDNAVRKPPPAPTLNDNANKGHVNQHSGSNTCSVNPPAAPFATNNKSDGCYFHPPPGNQWLIPVMSASEGLVYKPYTGPCPPTAGFLAPFYGGCGPISILPDPAFGAPSSRHQPVAQSYFHPYALPVTDAITSVVEKINPSRGVQAQQVQAEQMSMGEFNFNMQSGSSCNLSNQKSEAFSCCIRKLTSKDSELQDKSVSSPCVRVPRDCYYAEECDMLPLFPMAPAVKCSDKREQAPSNDQQIHVIKVVPHNARSATESVARIFRSIQEERQQFISL